MRLVALSSSKGTWVLTYLPLKGSELGPHLACEFVPGRYKSRN